ncbi:flagellar motor switch protein FliG [Frigidibacter sp. MR17.24]|uniref:flagellar motor switch protein FliG n=1 Tax=Frigidibacter sp. MR17.24 TaxID=3127345 RepID=UPI003012F8EF
MATPDNFDDLTGMEKAAIVFLCLGQARGSKLMQQLEEQEIQSISLAMAALGSVTPEMAERVMSQFVSGMADGGGIFGSQSATERMLAGFLPQEKVAGIMAEIRAPLSGRNVWDTFNQLNEHVIAGFLKDEHDQTAAAILSKVKADVAAKVLPLLGPERMAEVTGRMLDIDTLPRHVLEDIETVLEKDFLGAVTHRTGPDTQQRMADLFNKMDSAVFEQLSQHLEVRAPESFSEIKKKMFTFDDLARLDANSLARVMRAAEGNALPLALRGAKKEVRDVFLGALPARSREMLLDEMNTMGAVRAKEVQGAQVTLVEAAMELARQDVITLPMTDDDMLVD